MMRNHGAVLLRALLKDSPARGSAEPQVRPLAPCFTVWSQGRDMPSDIRPICFGAPDFCSFPLVNDALESRRVHQEHRSGTAETHLPPNRPQITAPSAPLDVQILVFSEGLGGKDESADRAESLPRSAIVPVKFTGYIESGDVQSTITIMFGGNMYENLRYDPTVLWSPDPESFSGLRKRKNHCAPSMRPEPALQ